MESGEYDALRRRVRELRIGEQKVGSSGVPASVQLLRDLLKNKVSDEDYVALSGLLLQEYAAFGMHDEEESLLRDEIGRFPDQPIPQIALADFLGTVREDFAQALTVAEMAVETALAIGGFVRDAYNCRARLAVKTRNYELLEKTLERLIDYRPAAGSQNVRYETDFLSNLPKNTVDADLLRRYLKVSKKNGNSA